jgi:hypothetical protein
MHIYNSITNIVLKNYHCVLYFVEVTYIAFKLERNLRCNSLGVPVRRKQKDLVCSFCSFCSVKCFVSPEIYATDYIGITHGNIAAKNDRISGDGHLSRYE